MCVLSLVSLIWVNIVNMWFSLMCLLILVLVFGLICDRFLPFFFYRWVFAFFEIADGRLRG